MYRRVIITILLVSIFSALMVGILPPVVDCQNTQVMNSGLETPKYDFSERHNQFQIDDNSQKEILSFQIRSCEQIAPEDSCEFNEKSTEIEIFQIEETKPIQESTQGIIDGIEPASKSQELSDISQANPETISPPPPSSSPEVVSLTYYNATTGLQTTWALADSIVDIQIEVKGPFLIGDQIDFDMYKRVNNLPSAYWAGWYYVFDFNLGMNQSVIFNLWDVALDTNPLIYGELTGQVDAYYFALSKNLAIFYDGFNFQGHYLWMWGSLYFDYTSWQNSTLIEIALAEPGWSVKAWTFFEITNGPMASVSLDVRNIFDVSLWPDELWSSSIVSLASGGVVYPGKWVIYWTSFIPIPTNRAYSNDFGDTRGIYVEVWRNGVQIYHGGEKGYELHVLPNIPNRAPLVTLSYPTDGQLIETSTANAYCKIIDPNSPFDIETLTVYLDGAAFDITSYYSTTTQSASFTIIIPGGYLGLLNITVVATDEAGASGYDTSLALVYPPESVFPLNYQISEQQISGTLYSEVFEWQQTLSWSSDENWNITITPFIRFSFTLNSSIHLIFGIPSEVDAGDVITALLKVSSVDFPLRLRLEIGFDYYFLADGMYEYANSWLFLNKTWDTSVPIDLGVDTIDLRYDIPEISHIIQALTHYTFSTSDILPAPISWLAELILTLDIVPILKLQNSLVCSLSGTGLDPDTSSLTWISTDMIGVNCSVHTNLDGTDTVNLDLLSFNLHSSLGMNIGTNMTLSGNFLTMPMFSININQWMQDYLGILIPTTDIWLLDVLVPLSGSANVQANVNPKTMETTINGFFADEDQIQVTILLHDIHDNPIIGATVTGQIAATPYSASELGGGLYRFTLPYTSISFDLDIQATLAGHLTASQTITIFIDPITVDETPPQIAGTTNTPTEPQENEAVTVTATITDALTGVKNASIYYSVDSGTWTRIAMTHSGDLYQATIPSQSAGSSVRYYIESFDNAGHRRASSTYSYSVQSTTTTEPPPTTPPTTTEPPTTPPPGIPGFTIEAIIIGLMATLGLGVLIRRRRRR